MDLRCTRDQKKKKTKSGLKEVMTTFRAPNYANRVRVERDVKWEFSIYVEIENRG